MREKLIAKYRYSLVLLKELVKTDFKLRYQGSVLGYLWSLLKPLFLFVILYFVFVHFLRIQGGPHWPVAMLFGIVLWNFFAEITGNGVMAIVNRGDVIRKINFPKYIIIVSSSVSALINLFINLVVLVVFMIISGVDLHWTALLTPLYVLELFVFAVGLSFILSTIFVKLRDVGYIWEIIMQALFYGSAVIYPLSMIVDKSTLLAQVLLLNPIAQSIQGARNALIDPSNIVVFDLTSNPFIILFPLALVLATFIFGAWLFKKKSPYFAENV
ncbi:MAG: ABC transporter permease [Candidatus Nomurabacteria bacterium]|jgi:ABC-2 type transport system permease protein|nr:ABC transporter permease [Candidatus Nomurabacteria bacterium]